MSTTTGLAFTGNAMAYVLGRHRERFEGSLKALGEQRAVRRMRERDGSLWSSDAGVRAAVESRLGWLGLPQSASEHVARLRAFARDVRADGLARAVLLGMGGSSLAPEVMGAILGVTPNGIEVVILDSTDPAQIRRVERAGDLRQTLFIVSSKSGGTAETDNLMAYFQARLESLVGPDRWQRQFVAITDSGTALEAKALQLGLRAVFTPPRDVGGRYSALTLFGLVPAALLGVDLGTLLERAQNMATARSQEGDPLTNPGLVLGAIMGALASTRDGPCDKLTLITSPELAPFGPWVEQLVAESTGKSGLGVLPVVEEPLGPVEQYGDDRLFVYLRLRGGGNGETDRLAVELVAAGHPIVLIPWQEPYDLGAEFYRWEFATAVAGQVLGINPFDQPDVEAAKSQARSALARYEQTHSLPEEPPQLREGVLSLFGPDLAAACVSDYLRRFLNDLQPSDYVALMAYIDRCAEHEGPLQAIRGALRARYTVATTAGFGPRLLHSTGQLHKGDANHGLFLQLTQDEPDDLPIPGRAYTFGVLKKAQALGDLLALRAAGRRVLRINLGPDALAGLLALKAAVQGALA